MEVLKNNILIQENTGKMLDLDILNEKTKQTEMIEKTKQTEMIEKTNQEIEKTNQEIEKTKQTELELKIEIENTKQLELQLQILKHKSSNNK
jgi:hypothetical protein